MAKRILVTGGAGFIGSHLCEALVRDGHHVTAIDNFDPMYPRQQKEANISWLRAQKNFTFINSDVRDGKKMSTVFSKGKFDFVYHLAGRGGIRQSMQDPLFYIDDIVVGTVHILENCVRCGVPMMVNASTSSLYAQTNGKPSKERDDTDHPGSVYAAAKKSAELLAYAYHLEYKLGVANVRFFSVYGPRGRPDMIVYKFTKNITEKKTIANIWPDPKRDFTYVSDIVDGLVAMLALKSGTYEIFNIGYGKPVAVMRAISIIEKTLGKKAIIGKKIKAASSDMAVTNADTTHIRKMLGWKPKVTFEQGVEKFVHWYVSHPQYVDGG